MIAKPRHTRTAGPISKLVLQSVLMRTVAIIHVPPGSIGVSDPVGPRHFIKLSAAQRVPHLIHFNTDNPRPSMPGKDADEPAGSIERLDTGETPENFGPTCHDLSLTRP